jgi:hypothetical protein
MEFQKETSILATPKPKSYSNISNLILFIDGHSNDSSCTHQELPKDVVQVICTIGPIEFIYESIFDQRGVFSWMRNFSNSNTNISIDKRNIICFLGKVLYLRPGSSSSIGSNIQIDKEFQRTKTIDMFGQLMEGTLYSHSMDTFFFRR